MKYLLQATSFVFPQLLLPKTPEKHPPASRVVKQKGWRGRGAVRPKLLAQLVDGTQEGHGEEVAGGRLWLLKGSDRKGGTVRPIQLTAQVLPRGGAEVQVKEGRGWAMPQMLPAFACLLSQCHSRMKPQAPSSDV